ncbi:flavodoxin [Stenotrophomonas sp. GD04145]|jgi:flavodoxin|uniref:flavodoxin n=1 Tax=unclassified Stenotrophomonas TaxID=196198 RepID=UPI001009D48E|nr:MULTISPECIES: flavodoxin [unclassified Stenotrophomonas]MDH0169938.1 flavodoxin [Stenotrophomonas sp. GD04145]RXK68339.1 flavodoxin [Stenotrophomonas sp. MA5]
MTIPNPNLGRRAVIAALASLPLGCSATVPEEGMVADRSSARTLIACFSRSGNTRVVAGLIHRSMPSDLFEIQTAVDYPADYLETVAKARQERDDDVEPALRTRITGIDRYDTVYLGFPIWGETTPPIIRSLLSQHDMSGKTIVPFITHGGYGVGSSLRVLARHAPDARILQAFVMQADQERKTMESVNAWLAAPHTPR